MAVVLSLALALGVITSSGGQQNLIASDPPTVSVNVVQAGFPVKDCAATAAITTGGALGLAAGGFGATAATSAALFTGTSAAAFHSAMIGVVWSIADPGRKCTQHVGNSAATAICNASHFSSWDPRGRAARAIVRLATMNEYSRC